ncbi:MAG: hypothetical protein ACOCXA_01635, partial [Planctomycetota bacterium]
LAEVDRAAGLARLYIDGIEATSAAFDLPTDLSLANDADLLVGTDPSGAHLACTIDFLRIARSTLADAQTDIEELYAWQFEGPFLRDFTGAEPVDRRDAGALEAR